MKKLIADIPNDVHKELKMVALEFDKSMKDIVNMMLFDTLVANLKNFDPVIKMKLNISNDDLGERLSKLRMSRHTG